MSIILLTWIYLRTIEIAWIFENDDLTELSNELNNYQEQLDKWALIGELKKNKTYHHQLP